MPITVQVCDPPADKKPAGGKVNLKSEGSIPQVSEILYPRIVAIIGYITKMLEGLISLSPSGTITIGFHEGLLIGSGEIEVPPGFESPLRLYLDELNRHFASLAWGSAKADFRFHVTYTPTWR